MLEFIAVSIPIGLALLGVIGIITHRWSMNKYFEDVRNEPNDNDNED